jgi:prepilin-type N-terminal cleavage/methylation domain-containing protein
MRFQTGLQDGCLHGNQRTHFANLVCTPTHHLVKRLVPSSSMKAKNPNPRMKYRPRSGFTLTELLVVIVIIVTLAALSFVTVSRIRARANNVLALNNMRQFGTGIAGFLSDQGHLPRFSGTGVSAALSTGNKLTQAYVLQPYLGLPEPTSTVQYPDVLKPPGLKIDNMASRKNWYEVTCFAMYSTNDIHKAKAYFPKGVMSDSTGADVGPFGRNGTGGNPTSEGWSPGVMDAALAKYSADNGGKPADYSMVPAMLEINAKYPSIKGSWPWPVPQNPVRDTHVNVLYFDWHVGSVKPDYFFKP